MLMRCVWGCALSWKSSGTEDGNKGKSRAGSIVPRTAHKLSRPTFLASGCQARRCPR
ncbi:conserved hypothetical protein [Prevotella intermedia]|uniref:Uncharacterized protein n=1 Tax=Prevotella intermedia TaxID=28131 RepID=A0A0T7ANG5_PREIN|nr:conserved hypothetical protein [Prevotella intermedia]